MPTAPRDDTGPEAEPPGPRAPSATSLLLTVLGEFVLPGGGQAWTATLVHALGLLGTTEKNARQALLRTASAGHLESDRIGRTTRWHLTDAGRRLLAEGAERIYAFPAPLGGVDAAGGDAGGVDAGGGDGSGGWDGRWLVLSVSVPEQSRTLRHRLRTRLSWIGFGSPAPGIWVSPHAAKEAETKKVIDELDLHGRVFSWVGRFGELGRLETLVRQAWNLDELSAHYHAFIERFAPMHPADPDNVLAAQLRIVHAWRRFPFEDPALPDELLPTAWIGHRAARVFHDRNARWHAPSQARWAEVEHRS